MSYQGLEPNLPLIQNADLNGKVVLIRFDHNVVKNGKIKDPYRIDATLGTLYHIAERGGRPILMTHIGRPRDKKTGDITCKQGESVSPIVEYLKHKLHTDFYIPDFNIDPKLGILEIDTSINLAIRDLRNRKIGGIYLPNTRWFYGEESEGKIREKLARQLAGLADIYVNDAFGSWQSHVSTYDITKHLPSYTGFLMQQEIINLNNVLNPERPFIAVVAGSKYDTKIKPLYSIYEKSDNIILGGVIYNTFLCAKYGIKIEGVSDSDILQAKDLVEKDRENKKIIELPYIVESETMEGKIEGKFRTISIKDFKEGNKYNYILDIDPKSFNDSFVTDKILNAKTIFVNAVMGYTPHFTQGSFSLDSAIDKNRIALKMYGGGDTLQEFKDLCPGLYLSVMENTQYYFFTGGGTVLKAIEKNGAYGLKPVQALIDNKTNISSINPDIYHK